MPSEWGRVTTVGELLSRDGGSVKTGPFGTALKASEYSATGVPLISVREIGHGEFCVDEKTPRVTEATIERLPDYLLLDGDIVFARKGSVDRCAKVGKRQEGWFLGSDGIRLRPPKSVDSRFLLYWFLSAQSKEWLNQQATGSTMASLNQAIIGRIPIVLPSLEEQREVAATLGALDDKIALLRETNATLEAIAQALFKSWFVDFDPVRAKAEGRDPVGVPPEVADLFPSEFEDSELGEIPKGWRVGRLGDVLKQRVERAKPCSQTEQIPYVPIECISSKSVFLVESRPGIEAQSSLTLFRKGDIVFGAMRPYFHKVCLAPFDGVTRTTAFVLAPTKPEMAMFALFQMFDDRTIEFATNHSEGSTIPYAKWTGSMENMGIVVPTDDVAAAFGEIVDGLMRRGIQNTEQSQSLAELRDTLLPRLMSGKLRITETQETVEEATA